MVNWDQLHLSQTLFHLPYYILSLAIAEQDAKDSASVEKWDLAAHICVDTVLVMGAVIEQYLVKKKNKYMVMPPKLN